MISRAMSFKTATVALLAAHHLVSDGAIQGPAALPAHGKRSWANLISRDDKKDGIFSAEVKKLLLRKLGRESLKEAVQVEKMLQKTSGYTYDRCSIMTSGYTYDGHGLRHFAWETYGILAGATRPHGRARDDESRDQDKHLKSYKSALEAFSKFLDATKEQLQEAKWEGYENGRMVFIQGEGQEMRSFFEIKSKALPDNLNQVSSSFREANYKAAAQTSGCAKNVEFALSKAEKGDLKVPVQTYFGEVLQEIRRYALTCRTNVTVLKRLIPLAKKYAPASEENVRSDLKKAEEAAAEIGVALEKAEEAEKKAKKCIDSAASESDPPLEEKAEDSEAPTTPPSSTSKLLDEEVVEPPSEKEEGRKTHLRGAQKAENDAVGKGASSSNAPAQISVFGKPVYSLAELKKGSTFPDGVDPGKREEHLAVEEFRVLLGKAGTKMGDAGEILEIPAEEIKGAWKNLSMWRRKTLKEAHNIF